LAIVAELGRALDLVTLVAHADSRLVVRKIVDAAIYVFMNNSTRLEEGLFDVLSRLSGRLHEDETVLASEHLSLIRADLPAGVQVTLISNEHDGHVGVAVLLDLLEPPSQMGERVASRDVIHEEGAGRAAIVRPGDALERLLASRVPDL